MCIDSSQPTLVTYNCLVGSSEGEFSVYKDNTFFDNQATLILANQEIRFEIPDSLGTLKAVSNNSCGMDIATTTLSLCGKLVHMFGSKLIQLKYYVCAIHNITISRFESDHM